MAINKKALADKIKINTNLYGDAETQRAIQEQEFKEWAEKEGLVKADSIPVGNNSVIEVDVARLKPSPLNHFSKRTQEDFQSLVASIKELGIIETPIVRPIKGTFDYEILAGNHRHRAAVELGFKTIKVNVVNVDDVEALGIISSTNIYGRKNISDREIGRVYRNMYNEKAKKQGARTDLTCGRQAHKFRNATTYELIAAEYGVSEKTVRRKIRLTYLIEPIYNYYEKKKLTQEVVEQLSYLTESEQMIIFDLLGEFTLSKGILKLLKNESKRRQRADEPEMVCAEIRNILSHGDSGTVAEHDKNYFETELDLSLFPNDIITHEDRNEYLNKAVEFAQKRGFVAPNMEQ